MDHIDAMLQCDANNVLLSKVRPYRCQTLPNHVTLITLVPVSAHAIFVRVNSDGGHGEFMGSPEDTDSDLSTIRDENLLQRTSMTGLLVPQGLDAVECQEGTGLV